MSPLLADSVFSDRRSTSSQFLPSLYLLDSSAPQVSYSRLAAPAQPRPLVVPSSSRPLPPSRLRSDTLSARLRNPHIGSAIPPAASALPRCMLGRAPRPL